MKQLVFATENPGKLAEIRKFASHFDIEILSPSQAGFAPVSVDETGTTYEENARLKVEAYLSQDIAKDYIICGDDSGIEIDALGGEPGLHTRRWLGYSMSDDEIVGYALGRMHGIDNRIATFKSTIAYSKHAGVVEFVTGEMKATIATVPLDDAPKQEGFPFRRLLIVDGEPSIALWRFDELSPSERPGRYSHREAAFATLFEKI